LCSRNTGEAIDKYGNKEKINRKDNVYLIDFAIDRMFNMAVKSAEAQGTAKGMTRPDEIQDIMKENLHNMPMFTEHLYDGNGQKVLNSMHEVNPKDLLKLFAKYNRDKSIEEAINDSITFNKFKGFLGNVDNLRLVKHFSMEGLTSRNIMNPEGTDIIEIDNVSTGGGLTEPEDKGTGKNGGNNNKMSTEEKKMLKELEGKFRNMLKRLMYSCICLEKRVRSVDDYIKLMETDKLTQEMCNEFMIDKDVIKTVYETLSPSEKMNVNMIIVQIDELLNDKELEPIDRVMNCVSKLGKMDKAEYITP